MAPLQRPDMGDTCIRDPHAAGAQFGDDALYLGYIPDLCGFLR